MRVSTGTLVWTLLVSFRYVFAQEATPIPTFDPDDIAFREKDASDHQSTVGQDVVESALPAARPTSASSSASVLDHTRRPEAASLAPTTHPTHSHSHSHSLNVSRTAWPHTRPSFLPPPFGGKDNPNAQSPNNLHDADPHKVSTVGVVFAALGGVALLLMLLAMARCYYTWRRTPRRDRIQALLQRHNLEREMEEREREDLARRVRQRTVVSWRPPPPPYQHAPSYDDTVSRPPPVAQV